MTNLPRNVLALLYRQLHTLFPGLVLTVSSLVTWADLLTQSLTLRLVTKISHYNCVMISKASTDIV